jgi:hypothetical protein
MGAGMGTGMGTGVGVGPEPEQEPESEVEQPNWQRLSPSLLYVLYEKVGFLENRCNTVKRADTVVQPLMDR